MILRVCKQYFYLSIFAYRVWLFILFMVFCLISKSQNPISDSINESIFFDLRKQNHQDSLSNFFDNDNAPSPEMVGQRKYIRSAFESGKALPTIYRKEEKDVEGESPNNQ